MERACEQRAGLEEGPAASVVLGESAVARAIELSVEKYCSASAMLRPGVTITHRYSIEEPEDDLQIEDDDG